MPRARSLLRSPGRPPARQRGPAIHQHLPRPAPSRIHVRYRRPSELCHSSLLACAQPPSELRCRSPTRGSHLSSAATQPRARCHLSFSAARSSPTVVRAPPSLTRRGPSPSKVHLGSPLHLGSSLRRRRHWHSARRRRSPTQPCAARADGGRRGRSGSIPSPRFRGMGRTRIKGVYSFAGSTRPTFSSKSPTKPGFI